MRIAFALAASLFAASAIAGPLDDGRRLHAVTAEAAALFVGLLERAATRDPAVVADALRHDVKDPVSRANTAWLKAISGDRTVWARTLPCSEAAFTLAELASDHASWLEGRRDRPQAASDITYFQEQFTRCEIALKLPVTFTDVAAGLSD